MHSIIQFMQQRVQNFSTRINLNVLDKDLTCTNEILATVLLFRTENCPRAVLCKGFHIEKAESVKSYGLQFSTNAAVRSFPTWQQRQAPRPTQVSSSQVGSTKHHILCNAVSLQTVRHEWNKSLSFQGFRHILTWYLMQLNLGIYKLANAFI